MMDLLTIDSGIGDLIFSCSTNATCKVVPASPDLPPGKSVVRCRAVILNVTHQESNCVLQFGVRCPMRAEGSPCSGQCLEAQEWQYGAHLLVIGTEDAEALNARMPFLGLEDFDAVVEYYSHAMIIRLEAVPPCHEITLHFIIAENLFPEPAADSAWFAVDIPHRALATA
jgi:hypothetical protein